MKILIVGAGEVGFNIAARLVEEGHDVVLLERDQEVLARAAEGLDIQGIRGHGARPKVLLEAGVTEADMVVAVTDSDEVNMVACFNAARLGTSNIIKIARVRDVGYLDEQFLNDPRVAIDQVINPERVTADKILRLLRFPAISEAADFAGGKVLLLGLPIRPTNPLAGVRFVDLFERLPGLHVLIVAIQRGGGVIIPRGSDVVLPGDDVFFAVRAEEAPKLLATIGLNVDPARRVMIAGGSKIGRFLAADLEAAGLKPKLVEPDARRCRWMSDDLTGTVILNGNPTDADLLTQENCGEMEAFVAVGRDEEMNIMSALLAQRLGARRVIAITNRSDYVPIMRSIGIDVAVSPRLVAVSSILHLIRRGRVVAVRSLGDSGAAEVLEFEAQLTSDIVGTPLHALHLPRNSLVATIQRGDEVIIPHGDTVIEEGDHVLVAALKSAVAEVERMVVRRVDR